MKVLIEAPFTLTDQEKENLNEKVTTLETFNNKITQVGIFFKLDDGNMPDAVLAEIEVHVPGPVVFASDIAEDYLQAFNGALSKAKRQMKKLKEIRKSHS